MQTYLKQSMEGVPLGINERGSEDWRRRLAPRVWVNAPPPPKVWRSLAMGYELALVQNARILTRDMENAMGYRGVWV